MYTSILLETLNVTGPIFLIVLLGLVLRRVGFLDDHFNEISARLVFSICLPVLLFTAITSIDTAAAFDWDAIHFSVVGTVVTFLVAWAASLLIEPRQDRGVFVQGAFRSNLGVIGLALAANAFGREGLALASLLMAGMTVTYNILSVFILSYYSNVQLVWRDVLVDILRNPLIVAIALAAVVAGLDLPVPGIVRSAGNYLGGLALPLALLGTGAGLSLKALRAASWTTFLAVMLKTLLLPGLLVVAALVLDIRGLALGVLFLLLASPTATASYAMVKATGGNDTLAANLVMASTLVSVVTCSLGFFLLRINGWI